MRALLFPFCRVDDQWHLPFETIIVDSSFASSFFPFFPFFFFLFSFSQVDDQWPLHSEITIVDFPFSFFLFSFFPFASFFTPSAAANTVVGRVLPYGGIYLDRQVDDKSDDICHDWE